MLSSEGSKLTRLILSRHTLICKAIELDTKYELLAQIDAQVRYDHAAARVHRSFDRRRRRMQAELILVPALVDDLEGQIECARLRLDSVLPKIVD